LASTSENLERNIKRGIYEKGRLRLLFFGMPILLNLFLD